MRASEWLPARRPVPRLRPVRGPRRVAVLSLHTSPLDQPGTGDAGGMNVYIRAVARELARRGVASEIFTRAVSSELPPSVELEAGVTVRHVAAGPFEPLAKEDLPGQLCGFAAGVLRAEAAHDPGHYDLVHSHYWLSGQVGLLAAERWGVPLLHSAHTLAKVKNAALAWGDRPEPRLRVLGEQQVVQAADALLAPTTAEAEQLTDLYGADPSRIAVVPPGVDLEVFRPGEASTTRTRLGVPPDGLLLGFAGRLQPLKGPDVLLRAVAVLLEQEPQWRSRLVVAICGGPSGSDAGWLPGLAAGLGITEQVRFLPPCTHEELAAFYRAADLIALPSSNESFGLVAVEAQACGTPVVATAVGGLTTAVAHGHSGMLVDGLAPAAWADTLRPLLHDAGARRRLAAGSLAHAQRFGWGATAQGVLDAATDAARVRQGAVA